MSSGSIRGGDGTLADVIVCGRGGRGGRGGRSECRGRGDVDLDLDRGCCADVAATVAMP
jgi:hypothetical protein